MLVDLIERMLSVQAELVRQVQALTQEVRSLRPAADATAQRACEAIVTSYGTGAARVRFYAVDVIEFAAAQPVLRAELRQALQRLCRTDCTPTAQQLGIALRQLVTAPPAGFAVEATDRRGTTQWLIVDMRDRLPPAPQ